MTDGNTVTGYVSHKHVNCYQAENMAASLLIYTKEEESSVVHFLGRRCAGC